MKQTVQKDVLRLTAFQRSLTLILGYPAMFGFKKLISGDPTYSREESSSMNDFDYLMLTNDSGSMKQDLSWLMIWFAIPILLQDSQSRPVRIACTTIGISWMVLGLAEKALRPFLVKREIKTGSQFTKFLLCLNITALLISLACTLAVEFFLFPMNN